MFSSHFFRKAIVILLVVSALFGAVSVPANAFAVKDTSILQEYQRQAKLAASGRESYKSIVVEDGIYRFVNCGSGKLLEAFDYSFDAEGRMHLDYARGIPAQDFAVVRHDDGSYSLCPQNDGASFMISYKTGSGDASLYKSSVNDLNSRFRILYNSDGTYSIIPAAGELSGCRLGESSVKAHWNYNLCQVLPANSLSAFQKWRLEKTDSKIDVAVSMSSTQLAMQVYSVEQLFVVVAPAAYMDGVVWSSDDPKVAFVDENGVVGALKEGKATITASVAGNTVSCVVTVSARNAFTWYSQCNAYTGGWNAAQLSNVWFAADGWLKPFMVDGFNGRTDWMDEGCTLTCAAMIFNNLGAKMTEGYDFRSGQTSNLIADPYTLALANSYNYGSKTANSVNYYNPIYTMMPVIAERFNVNGAKIVPSTYYYPTRQLIKDLLEDHPEGVIVGFENGYIGSHYLVFTECINPDAEYWYEYEFIVCDPAAYDEKDGNNVPFTQSTSYTSYYYRYNDMWSVTFFDVQ